MSIDPTHQVGLNPSLLTSLLAILMVKPSGISSGGEARRVNGKVSLNSLKRTGTLLNKGFEERCQFWIFQIAESTIVMGSLRNQPIFLSLFQLSGESPPRHSCIGLEYQTKYYIRQRQSWATKPVFWLCNSITEVTEQGNKVFLFVGLCGIVGSPVLIIGYSNSLGVSSSAIGLGLSLDNAFYSVNMLAGLMASLIIRAGAKWLPVVKVYDIRAITRLGRYFPSQSILFNLRSCCYYQSFFLSRIHRMLK